MRVAVVGWVISGVAGIVVGWVAATAVYEGVRILERIEERKRHENYR